LLIYKASSAKLGAFSGGNADQVLVAAISVAAIKLCARLLDPGARLRLSASCRGVDRGKSDKSGSESPQQHTPGTPGSQPPGHSIELLSVHEFLRAATVATSTARG
jgi:hypothetical protein